MEEIYCKDKNLKRFSRLNSCIYCGNYKIILELNTCSPGVGSASKLRDFDDWQDPRLSTTDDDLISPYSDSSTNDLDQIRPQELTKNGTYVIRRGRKKERKVLPKTPTKTKSLSFENGEDGRLSDVKRYSSTFDNIKSLLKEGKLEGLDEPPPEFAASVPPPDLIRVVSMPAINNDPNSRAQLEITVEEEETSDVSDKDRERDNIELPRLPPSPLEEDRMDRSRDCNIAPTALNQDTGKSSANPGEPQVRKKLAVSDERLASKIPVNLLIEDQIVKKALKENRRQLEKVSDAIKEIENVRNSESYGESKRWRNGDLRQNSSKRNSFENEPPTYDGRKPVTVDGSPFDGRSRGKQQQQQQQYSSDSETSKASSDADFADRRKLNGVADVVYSSGRRLRQNGIESHKNDQKQIENVIDAILEDSKNPEFQVGRWVAGPGEKFHRLRRVFWVFRIIIIPRASFKQRRRDGRNGNKDSALLATKVYLHEKCKAGNIYTAYTP